MKMKEEIGEFSPYSRIRMHIYARSVTDTAADQKATSLAEVSPELWIYC